MWARPSCPPWRVSRLAVLVAACVLSYMPAAATAHASGPLGGQPIAVPSAPAAVSTAAAPAVAATRTAVASVRHTAERSVAAAAPVAAPVADISATVDRSVTAATTTVQRVAPSSPKPAASQRHQPRHRRGGGATAHAASATPASAADRAPRHRSTVAKPALPVIVAAAPEHSAAQRVAAPHRTLRHGTVAPVPAPAPQTATATTTAASGAGSSAGSAAAVLALLALLTLASPRLGDLLRLAKGWAPMPPLLATPERPG
jgi:hypothetical protein